MTNPLVVIVPAVPVRALSPNASRKQHWGHAAKARTALRTAAAAAMTDVLSTRVEPLPRPPYRVSVRVEWGKAQRTMDDDNVIAALKAARDTIAAKMGVDDAAWQYAGVEQHRDLDGRGRTAFTIEEASQ